MMIWASPFAAASSRFFFLLICSLLVAAASCCSLLTDSLLSYYRQQLAELWWWGEEEEQQRRQKKRKKKNKKEIARCMIDCWMMRRPQNCHVTGVKGFIMIRCRSEWIMTFVGGTFSRTAKRHWRLKDQRLRQQQNCWFFLISFLLLFHKNQIFHYNPIFLPYAIRVSTHTHFITMTANRCPPSAPCLQAQTSSTSTVQSPRGFPDDPLYPIHHHIGGGRPLKPFEIIDVIQSALDLIDDDDFFSESSSTSLEGDAQWERRPELSSTPDIKKVIHFSTYIPHAHISQIDRFNRYMLDTSYI